MTLRFASPTNGYLPESTGQVVAFIRQASKFKLNRYVQLVKCDAPTGVYSILGRDEAVRVVSDNEVRWEDGSDMPDGNQFKSRFEIAEFRCIRRAYPWRIGNVSVNTAKLWKPKLVQMAEAISQAMTNRTALIISQLETAGNWGSNTNKATVLNGGRGFWNLGSDMPDSPYFNAIASTLLEAFRQINLYTNSVVQISDLRLVISPGAAIKMSQSAEIKHALSNSRFAQKTQESPGSNVNELWGLPDHYMGVELVVEDASRVTERPRAAASSTASQATNPGNRNYIKSDNSAVIVSRPGGLDGEYGSESFSTVQVFYYEELLRVKAEYESWHERWRGAVVEYFVPKIVAAPAGYLITNLFS